MKDMLPVTGKRLDAILDARDEWAENRAQEVEKKFEDFTREQVERLAAIESAVGRVSETLMRTTDQLLGVIELSNTLQPQAESMDINYFVVATDAQGFEFLQSTSRDGYDRAKLENRPAYRQLVILEKAAMDPERYGHAMEVVEHVRQNEVER